MYLTRKTAQILYRLMLVAWVFAFAIGVIEGCLAQEGSTSGMFSVPAVPVATVAEADHDDSGTAHGLVCQQFCQNAASPSQFASSASTLPSSVFPLLLWVTLLSLTLTMASSAMSVSLRPSRATSCATRPYLLFQRFNN